jgi:hypothetical protein
MLAHYAEFHLRAWLASILFQDDEPEAGETLRVNTVNFVAELVNARARYTFAGIANCAEAGVANVEAQLIDDATDLVVRSQVTQRANTQPIALDYRLEKTPQGWKIYDLNVENIWLIENYRNQFSQQITQNGIDGLIQALNQRAQQQ